jgi:hypothetical protein
LECESGVQESRRPEVGMLSSWAGESGSPGSLECESGVQQSRSPEVRHQDFTGAPRAIWAQKARTVLESGSSHGAVESRDQELCDHLCGSDPSRLVVSPGVNTSVNMRMA